MDEENGPGRLDRYVEALRARMPAAEFITLMRAFHAWRGAPHASPFPADTGALGTPEIQAEMLTLMRLTGPPPSLTATPHAPRDLLLDGTVPEPDPH